MSQLTNPKMLLIESSIFMFLFSTSFLIMPLASELSLSGDNFLLTVTALWFWLSAILSGITFLLANKKRKAATGTIKSRPGIFCFFKNPWAKLADAAFGVSLSGLILVTITASKSYLPYILVSLSVFTFLMHCVLNGKNYQYAIETCNPRKFASKGEEKK